MRALLISEASGVHRNLQRGLQALGHEAVLVMTGERSYQGRTADLFFDQPRDRLVGNLRGKLRDTVLPELSLRKLPSADVASYLLTLSLFDHGRNRYRDLRILKDRGCSLSYYGLGCDEVSLLRVRPDAAESPCPSCEAFDALGQSCRERLLGIRGRAREISGQVDFVASSLYEFSHCHLFFPAADHADIPLPVALDEIEFSGVRCDSAKPLIIHAPTRRGFKGTAQVLEALRLLRSAGVKFDFELVEGVTHAEFMHLMERADVAIDQIFSEGHGMAALECLAMGKVVLSGLGPMTRRYFPFASECPIIDAPSDPQSLSDTLRRTLARREEFDDLASRGRSYVSNHHDHVAVAKRFVDLWTRSDFAGQRRSRMPVSVLK